jgi:hypothetical protein
MSLKNVSREILLNDTSVVVGASETNTPVSDVLWVQDSLHIRVDITASSVTDASADSSIVAKIQDSVDKSTWNTKGSEGTVAITGNGTFSIVLLAENADDQAELPLRPFVRVVVTTAAGDTATIDSVVVSSAVA